MALASCTLAVISDLHARRIPNRLTAGPGTARLAAGFPCVVRWASVTPSSRLRSDSVSGFPMVVCMVACTLLAGGALALVQALAAGTLGAVADNVLRRRLVRRDRVDGSDHRLHVMAYALSIALGTLWAVSSQYLPALAVR